MLRPSEEEILQFSCETWSMSGQHLPVKEKSQIMQESPELCDWPLYIGNAIDLQLQIGKASPAAFSADCQTLRIGTKLFAKDPAGDFVALPRLPLRPNQSPAYVEEFCRRDRFVVLASRTRLLPRDVSADDALDTVEGKGSQNATETGHQDDPESSSDDSSTEGSFTEGSSTESEIETESEDDGYESWSDSSTMFSEDYIFDDDMITPWADHFRDDEDEASDSEIDSDSDEALVESDSSTSDDEDIVPPSAFGFGRVSNEEDYDWDQDHSSDNEGFVPRQIGGHGHDTKQARATITIFDTQTPEAVQLFHLTHPLQSKVYGSPPIIHPTRPLVVWPLGAGDVLFVDFMDKTYFVRRLRPSTLHSKYQLLPKNSKYQPRRKRDTFS